MCSQKSRLSIPVLCSMVLNFMLIPIKEGARVGVGSLVSKMQAFMYEISGFHKELITKAFNCCMTLSLPKWLLYFQERSGAAWELESGKFGREVKGYNLWLSEPDEAGNISRRWEMTGMYIACRIQNSCMLLDSLVCCSRTSALWLGLVALWDLVMSLIHRLQP